ncbi:MAG: aminotransferase class I/II-fold pyridoxal phosphate-dependent enzyme [Opitutales bacterium]
MDLYGTSYLGLQTHPEYLRILQENLQQYGVNNPMSRNNAGVFKVLERAETSLMEEWESEEACLLPNGFQAGQAVLAVCRDLDCPIYAQADGHPCYLPNVLADTSSSVALDRFGLIFDAVDPFTGLSNWMQKTSLELVHRADFKALDVSHVAGVWPSQDLIKHLNPERSPLTLYFGSLAKASAFPAGFVAGPRKIIRQIRALPQFTASSPPANYLAASFLDSTLLRSRLKGELSRIMKEVRRRLKLPDDPWAFPSFLLKTPNNSELSMLEAQGIHISALAYPSTHSPVRYRCVLNAMLSATELEQILKHLGHLVEHPLSSSQIQWSSISNRPEIT